MPPVSHLNTAAVLVHIVKAAASDKGSIGLLNEKCHQVLIEQESGIRTSAGLLRLFECGWRGYPPMPGRQPVEGLKNCGVEDHAIAGPGNANDQALAFDLLGEVDWHFLGRKVCGGTGGIKLRLNEKRYRRLSLVVQADKIAIQLSWVILLWFKFCQCGIATRTPLQ